MNSELLRQMFQRLAWTPVGRSGALMEAPMDPHKSRLSDKNWKARKKRNKDARMARRKNR